MQIREQLLANEAGIRKLIDRDFPFNESKLGITTVIKTVYRQRDGKYPGDYFHETFPTTFSTMLRHGLFSEEDMYTIYAHFIMSGVHREKQE